MSEIFVKPAPPSDENNQNLYYKNDSSALRLAGQDAEIRKKLEGIEKEMTALYPINELFRPAEAPDNLGKLAEIDFNLQEQC